MLVFERSRVQCRAHFEEEFEHVEHALEAPEDDDEDQRGDLGETERL